jgi:hypothetical protein
MGHSTALLYNRKRWTPKRSPTTASPQVGRIETGRRWEDGYA